MRMMCSIGECTAFCVGRGLCQKHYMRWKRHGDPNATPRWCSLSERFWRYVHKTDTCWIWTGALSKGYGRFCVSQRPTVCVSAHRFAYRELVGHLEDDMTLDHLCRNKACVNPQHLEPVTAKENPLYNPLQERPSTIRW